MGFKKFPGDEMNHHPDQLAKLKRKLLLELGLFDGKQCFVQLCADAVRALSRRAHE